MKKIISGCVAHNKGNCSAASPEISEVNIDFFPDDIKIKIKEKGLDAGIFKRCLYCGTVWAIYYDENQKINKEVELGTRELGNDRMIWFI